NLPGGTKVIPRLGESNSRILFIAGVLLSILTLFGYKKRED
ncbi:TPA: LPXTG cell wall anchor domain-containing protein, partial [Enterococcus faecalis]|nr:LPXTG cell wall anchor domain-containing protein [Enterococcus faecalis]